MLQKGEIWAYPTDTSFGLGVRADDEITLEKLADLKNRAKTKFFSLMVKDLKMLKFFAEVPDEIDDHFFQEKPRTAILKTKPTLPISHFWPQEAVAFRITTIPEVANAIVYPITATSANESGKPSLFSADEIRNIFGDAVQIFPGFESLPKTPPSEIWDFTKTPAQKIR